MHQIAPYSMHQIAQIEVKICKSSLCSGRGNTSSPTSGGSRGVRGFKPPPLGGPQKKNMCIEKRHHNNVQTHTVCSYITLSQAQLQTIGFNPPPLGCQVNMVSIVLVDARKTWHTGVQNSKKKSARRFAARGRCGVKRLHCDSRSQENITYSGSKQ